MKKISKSLLVGLLTLGFAQFTNAQKIAHINLDEVVAAMPETKSMQDSMEKLGKTYETEIQAARTSLKAKFDRYTAEEASKSPEENQQRAVEVQQDQAKIQQLQQVASQELQKKQNELLEPIIKKAQDAIKLYADQNGIKYVLDARSLIYAQGEDISAVIKTKLGIK